MKNKVLKNKLFSKAFQNEGWPFSFYLIPSLPELINWTLQGQILGPI